jgi:protease I
MAETLKGKRILILAEDLYEELELWYPRLRLQEEGAVVIIGGTGRDRHEGKHGYPVQVDVNVEDLNEPDYDALVITGGYAPDRLRRNESVLRLVRDTFREGKAVAAICHAAWVLISAGIIEDKHATCFFSIRDDVVNAGAKYSDHAVIRDGNLITSRQPSDLGDFCREIIDFLRNGEN